jgi:hypothetical protein
MFYISEYMKMLHTKQDSDTILTILQDIRNDIQQGIISHFIFWNIKHIIIRPYSVIPKLSYQPETQSSAEMCRSYLWSIYPALVLLEKVNSTDWIIVC